MKKNLLILALAIMAPVTANADVWKWVDAAGNTHYVDTLKSIYTWVDEFGKVHYGDTPDHEDAVLVKLVWHSSASLDELTADKDAPAVGTDAYYCKRASESYKAYLNAPQLDRTNDGGEREILTNEEATKMIAYTRDKIREYCGEDSPQVAELGQAGTSSHR